MEWLFFGLAALIAVALLAGWYVLREGARPAPQAPAAARDLIRISQRAAGSRLIWEIEGRRYLSLDEIKDEDRRALAIAVVRQLAGQLPPETAAPLPPEKERPSGTTTSSATSPTSGSHQPRADPAQPPDDDDFSRPLWQRMAEGIRPISPPPAPSAPLASPAASRMLDEIDDLFQENLARLAAAPEARVRAAANGGMMIVVGGRVYDSIESIPQAEVAAALRQAVKTWEERV